MERDRRQVVFVFEPSEPEAPPRTLTAADLLAVKSASGRIPEGLTAKKVLVLGNYVKHLRAADKHVH